MNQVKFCVEGMSCSHCVKAIEEAVRQIKGIQDITISLADKSVTVNYDGSAEMKDAIKEAIEDQGYDVE